MDGSNTFLFPLGVFRPIFRHFCCLVLGSQCIFFWVEFFIGGVPVCVTVCSGITDFLCGFLMVP